jgi:hypothetical protein
VNPKTNPEFTVFSTKQQIISDEQFTCYDELLIYVGKYVFKICNSLNNSDDFLVDLKFIFLRRKNPYFFVKCQHSTVCSHESQLALNSVAADLITLLRTKLIILLRQIIKIKTKFRQFSSRHEGVNSACDKSIFDRKFKIEKIMKMERIQVQWSMKPWFSKSSGSGPNSNDFGKFSMFGF